MGADIQFLLKDGIIIKKNSEKKPLSEKKKKN